MTRVNDSLILLDLSETEMQKLSTFINIYYTYLVCMCTYKIYERLGYSGLWKKQVCTMAWEVEVTFYREIEGTESLVSYLPSKWIQSWETECPLCQYYAKSKLFLLRERTNFSVKCHQRGTAAEAGSATGSMKGHCGKGLDEPMASCLCPHPSLRLPQGGREEARRPSRPPCPAV